jgi:hypothetical protein
VEDAALEDAGRRLTAAARGAVARAAVPALALLLAARVVLALEIAGVDFPSSLEAPGGSALVLNGAGIRSAFFLDVYAVGLYLPRSTPSAAEAIDAAGARRVAIRLLRDVGAERFSDALESGLRGNHSEALMQQLAPRIQQLREIMTELGVARAGLRIDLDLVPGVGTVVAIDGRPRGAPIPGEDFYRALLKNWLGERPVSADLKRALLGGGD